MKTFTRNKLTKLLLPVSICFLATNVNLFSQEFVSVQSLYLNASQYHKAEITTQGYVKDYKEKISKKGNPYTVFKLSDGRYYVKVFTFGKLGLAGNEKLKVTGTFYKVKYVGRYKFYNEITMQKFKILE